MVMGAFFTVMGIVIPFYPPPLLTKAGYTEYLWLIGFVLIVYGIFRFYRAYRMWRQLQKPQA